MQREVYNLFSESRSNEGNELLVFFVTTFCSSSLLGVSSFLGSDLFLIRAYNCSPKDVLFSSAMDDLSTFFEMDFTLSSKDFLEKPVTLSLFEGSGPDDLFSLFLVESPSFTVEDNFSTCFVALTAILSRGESSETRLLFFDTTLSKSFLLENNSDLRFSIFSSSLGNFMWSLIGVPSSSSISCFLVKVIDDKCHELLQKI